jgi:hypothetical protein
MTLSKIVKVRLIETHHIALIQQVREKRLSTESSSAEKKHC